MLYVFYINAITVIIDETNQILLAETFGNSLLHAGPKPASRGGEAPLKNNSPTPLTKSGH